MGELLKEIDVILSLTDPNCVKAVIIVRRVKRYIESISTIK